MRPATRRRRNGDDAAATTCLPRGKHTLDRQECRCQMALDGSAPPVLTDRFERTRLREATASVGDEDIDRSKLFLDTIPHRLDLWEGGDVGHDLERSSPTASDVTPH